MSPPKKSSTKIPRKSSKKQEREKIEEAQEQTEEKVHFETPEEYQIRMNEIRELEDEKIEEVQKKLKKEHVQTSEERKIQMDKMFALEEKERRREEEMNRQRLAKYHRNWDRLSDDIKKREDPERFLRESEAKALQMPDRASAPSPKGEEVVPGPEIQEESGLPNPIPPELEPPVETQIAPPETQRNSPTIQGPGETKIKKLIQLKSISEEDKQKIIEELKNDVENPYYRLKGKGIAYKDNKMKKRAKVGNVFENIEIVEKPKARENGATEIEEIPPPFSDTSATASMSEVAAVEKQVKPPPIKKRTLNLMNEARRNDLTDKGFISGGASPEEPPPAYGNRPRKLNLSNLTGMLDLGENRLKLSIGGPFN